MPSFPPRTQKHIIFACLALHNFVRDSNLHDKEFNTQEDDSPDVENEDTMNTIRNRIADALISARGS